MSKHQSSSHHDVDSELREILGDDAHPLLSGREHLRRQLDADAFAQRAVRVHRRSWFQQPLVWLSGAGGAVVAVLIFIAISDGTPMQPQTDAQAVQRVHAEHADVDVLIAETLASVDDVWEQGEDDIDRLLTERSTK